MVLIFEVPLASIAFVLIMVSSRTLRSLKHLSVGMSFWIPVLFSGIFFFAGSILTMLSGLGLWLTVYSVEVVSITRLLALCFLAGGVYTYSAKVSKNLVAMLFPPARVMEVESNEEAKSSQSLLEHLNQKVVVEEINCKHQLGYLRTLGRHAHIPEECLGCHRIIDCKYSVVKKTKSSPVKPKDSRTIPIVFSDFNLEKESSNRSE